MNADQVGDQAGNVRRGLRDHQRNTLESKMDGWAHHAGAGDLVGGVVAADPRADDVLAWGEDINDGAVVGEGGAGVGDVGRAYGDGGGCASGGSVSSVGVGVTCRDLR